jgi:hypothetical protein
MRHCPTLLPRLAATVLVAVPLLCQAGRPFVTEDAGVLAAGECEWENAALRVTASGAAAASSLATQVGCGTAWHTQVALAASRAKAEGESATSLTLLGKTSLTRDDKAPLQWTLAWGLARTRLPAGAGHDNTGFLNLVLSAALAEGWTGHANLGGTHSSAAGAASTSWALAAERAMGAGVDLGAEAFGDDRSQAWLGLGARWAVTPHFSVNGSAARQGGSGGQRLLSAGFKLQF